MRTHFWSQLTRGEIRDARNAGALVVIPIGSTEQHGEHLPVGTDSMASEKVCHLAAQECSHPVIIAPTVNIAFSPHHLSWPGTISYRLSTLINVLDDITRCIAEAGFKRQLIVNGHGGNRGPLISVTSELVTGGREVGYVDYFRPAISEVAALLKGKGGTVTHAGEMETSLIMALDQGDESKLNFYKKQAKDLSPFTKETFGSSELAPNPIAAAGAWWPSIYHGPDAGYNGEPARGSVATGEAIIAAMVPKLAGFFADFSAMELKSGVRRAP